MSLYKIADFVIDFKNKYPRIEKMCADYKCDDALIPDFVIEVNEADLEAERAVSEYDFPNSYLESICAYRKLAVQLPLHNALLLHGVVISCGGKGIAFVARSGVGKTTHTMLWQKNFEGEMVIINGDKPIIRFIDGVPFAYGTPWAGKEGIQVNDKVELTDICFIERDENNSTTLIEDKSEYFNLFMNQVLRPADPIAAMNTLELLDNLISKCNFWSIKCNISDEAAIIAHNAIFSLPLDGEGGPLAVDEVN